jgi:hypothetical protein
MTNIEERLKKLNLLDEAIDNEDDEWGNTPEEWEVHLEILVAGGAIEENMSQRLYASHIPLNDDTFDIFEDFSLFYNMFEEKLSDDSYSCPYTRINGSICGKKCNRIEGCINHWHRKNKGPGILCKFKSCKKFTRSPIGFCREHSGGTRYYYHKKA